MTMRLKSTCIWACHKCSPNTVIEKFEKSTEHYKSIQSFFFNGNPRQISSERLEDRIQYQYPSSWKPSPNVSLVDSVTKYLDKTFRRPLCHISDMQWLFAENGIQMVAKRNGFKTFENLLQTFYLQIVLQNTWIKPWDTPFAISHTCSGCLRKTAYKRLPNAMGLKRLKGFEKLVYNVFLNLSKQNL